MPQNVFPIEMLFTFLTIHFYNTCIMTSAGQVFGAMNAAMALVGPFATAFYNRLLYPSTATSFPAACYALAALLAAVPIGEIVYSNSDFPLQFYKYFEINVKFRVFVRVCMYERGGHGPYIRILRFLFR